MKKEISNYLKTSKKVYLLGKNQDGKKMWLNEPSWDCGWYWGFGYICEMNRPRTDINSHQHWDTSVVGPRMTKKDNQYCRNPFDSKFFSETTFTEAEGWKLAELFSRFYQLRSSAELFGRGGMHVSGDTSEELKKTDWTKEINEILIPLVTSQIIAILTPNN